MTPSQLQYIKEKLGYSDTDLAKRLGVSKVAVHYWLTGQRTISRQSVAAIHMLVRLQLGTTAEKLLADMP